MTQEKRKEVHNKFGGHCAYCGKPLLYSEMQVDHARPKIHYNQYNKEYYHHIGRNEDGSIKIDNIKDFQIDGIDNLMPSCRKCNHYKRSADVEEFRCQIATLIDRLRKDYINEVAENFGIYTYHEWDGLFYFEKFDGGKK